MDEPLAWPPELRFRFGSPETIRERSSGEVRAFDLLDWRTLQPVPEGLYCPEIFGPPKLWPRDRWGHLELAAPVAHVELYRGAPSLLAVALGMPQAALLRLLTTAPGEVLDRWERLSREHLMDELQERAGSRLTPRTVAGRLAALETLNDVPPFLTCLPVIPAAFRPYRLRGTKVSQHQVNDLYRIVLNRSNRVRILAGLSPPAEILLHERRALQTAVDQLLINRSLPKPRLGADGRPIHALEDLPAHLFEKP